MRRSSRTPRVLFATSNGTGLGHLNRAMAIARRLPHGSQASLFTLSQAAPVVARSGWEVDYLASYRRPASGTDRAWNLRLRDVFADIVAQRRPDVIVFDGVHPYRGLTHVLSARGAPRSIWCRRPLWRDGSATAPLRRCGAFDAVLEPGELAGIEDRGPTVALRAETRRVDPIVLLDREELLDRAAAAAALGLDPERRTALVALGQGDEVDRAVARSLEVLISQPDLQVAALQSSISPRLHVPAEVVRLEATYPMSRYYRAFDLAIAAPGYNAFHELVSFGVPSLFVPMRRETDDQAGRARWAAERKVGLAVTGAADPLLEERIEQLCDPTVTKRLAEGCEREAGANGAAAAAELVVAVARGERAAPAVRDRGRLNRWLRLSSHRIGPTLPLVLALGGRDLLRHPERRAPHLVILALGVAEDELGPRVERACRSTPRERVLVLTDSLAFDHLRRLGVGFERLPPSGNHRPPALDRISRRARLLLAGRRPLRVVSVGARGLEPLASNVEEGR